jgi:hypothetical protein
MSVPVPQKVALPVRMAAVEELASLRVRAQEARA